MQHQKFSHFFSTRPVCSLCCRRRLWKAQQATERKSVQPLAQRHAAAAIPVTLHRPSKVNNPLNTVSMWFTGGLPFTHAALRCEQSYLKNCLHLLDRDSVPKHLERTVQLQRGQWHNKQEEIAERVNTLLIPGQGVIRTLIYWILNPFASRGLAPTVSWLAWIQCRWWADLVSHRLEQCVWPEMKLN